VARIEYSEQDLAAIAAAYDEYAAGQDREADRLAALGYEDAAGIWRRGAEGSREIADAAREGSDRLNEVTNDD